MHMSPNPTGGHSIYITSTDNSTDNISTTPEVANMPICAALENKAFVAGVLVLSELLVMYT